MNAHMASRTILKAGIGHIVGSGLSGLPGTLQTEIPSAVMTLQT